MDPTNINLSSASGSSQQTSPSPMPPPGIEWVDKRQGKDHPLKKRNFKISIESVHYYRGDSGNVCCAVLLKTTFVLENEDKLASALVPLSASAPRTKEVSKEDEEKRIDISTHFPAETEWAEVTRISGTKDVSATPNISFGAGSLNAGVSGVGKNKHVQINKPKMISLNPVPDPVAGKPTCLNLYYEDKNAIFYPPTTNIMVIVEKFGSEEESWFPFELRLQWELRVDVHANPIIQSITRLVARLGQHEGWCFKIKGTYKPEAGMAAMKLAGDVNDTAVGLYHAIRPWKSAQTSPETPSASSSNTVPTGHIFM